MDSGDRWRRISATSSRHWRSHTVTRWFAHCFREGPRALADGTEWREPSALGPTSGGSAICGACWAFELVEPRLVTRWSVANLPSQDRRKRSPCSRRSPNGGRSHGYNSDGSRPTWLQLDLRQENDIEPMGGSRQTIL